ncbi:PilW family protein [Verrucomicrobiota bacterium]
MKSEISTKNQEPGVKNQAAFTLIELLVAMAVLMVIVAVVGMIFIESDRSWSLGTGRAENNAWGRAALNLMAHDLQYAVACSNEIRDVTNVISFLIQNDRNSLKSYDCVNSEAAFVSLQHDSTVSDRTAREIYYWIRKMKDNGGSAINNRYALIRGYYSDAIVSNNTVHCYGTPNWCKNLGRPGANAVVAENVASLKFYAMAENGTLSDSYDSTSPANSNRLPEYVDIVLDVLNEDDSIKAASKWSNDDADKAEFVDRNIRRYTTRVYFHNRHGYTDK